MLEYLLEVDQRYLEKLLQAKAQQRQEVEQILAVPGTGGQAFAMVITRLKER